MLPHTAFPSLTFGNLTAPTPIIQGGMGIGISGAGLAAAVANEGGIGVISAICLGMRAPGSRQDYAQANKEGLIREIRTARQKTSGVLGVNIMVACSDYDSLVLGAIEEEADLLFLGAGLPLQFPKELTPERMRTMHSKLVPIISSAKAANTLLKYWSKRFGRLPDGFVVEGPKAGGHLGFKREQIEDPAYALQRLIPEVVEAVRPYAEKYGQQIPVIAAGGVYSGADIAEFLELGASGVQMGTRFVATHECDADSKFKESFVQAKKEDLTIIQSPVGLPGRAINNAFLEDVAAGAKKPFTCPWHCLKTCDYKQSPYCIACALNQARAGRLKHGFAFAGANAWRVDAIISVQELMQSLADEFAEATALPEAALA
ncbi:NAD(P)H-dependent flavin oxidoreductase [Desulfohalobium retbaense]|uniref:2-nitropropane dioxygenase NPD n=1 Tax=Desulfohalobium retbaense (strain ATCC 49708 / DSM 5692 / JCM 16813 / HR100) TaxID=485915 RepID=C8X3Y8_DESRD|nr:nitronate monooxygenase family protein [Desulfohalobium retbaense]ACV69135.1 2-nitropropane dioxygenase NPD [Desulfohalobium retbaense DSM 5692]